MNFYSPVIINFFLLPLKINRLIQKIFKYYLKIIYKIITLYPIIFLFKKDNLEKIKRYKSLLSISEKINSVSIEKKVYKNSCLNIGILYGDMNLVHDAKHYLTLYLNKVPLPLIYNRNYSVEIKSNKPDKQISKKYNLKIICIFSDDSTLFIVLDLYKQFIPYCEVDLLYLESKDKEMLSKRQLQNIPKYISYKKIQHFSEIENQELISRYDAIITSKPISAKSFLFKLRKRPVIVSLYMGVDFFPTQGFINRRHSEIVCLNQRSQINLNSQLMPDLIKDYQTIIHYSPKFFRENLQKKYFSKEISKIYFLAQSIVPASLEGRKNILNMLINIAKKYSTKSIIIKLRHLENENKGHKHIEKYSYQSIAKNMELPPNLFFSADPFEKVLKDADYCITCSSTAGIETALNGIKTVFLFDYPKAEKEYLYLASKKVFINSGLISSYSEIIDLKFKKPEEEWEKDFICENSSIYNILDKVNELRNKTPNSH